MEKLNNISQIHSNLLNAKNLAIMEVYAMDILYAVNVERESNHTTINCNLNNRCANCEDHLSYTRSCPAWKKEKEILTIKHTRNIPYPEARKIVEGYIKNKTYSQNKVKKENYQELISKLLQLGPRDWPKFIQEIKPILLKLSSNSTNPKPMTELKLEKNIKIHWNKSL